MVSLKTLYFSFVRRFWILIQLIWDFYLVFLVWFSNIKVLFGSVLKMGIRMRLKIFEIILYCSCEKKKFSLIDFFFQWTIKSEEDLNLYVFSKQKWSIDTKIASPTYTFGFRYGPIRSDTSIYLYPFMRYTEIES